MTLNVLRDPLWLHDLFITHHITCTDTGLKTWVRPAVFTVNPLRCKHNCWSFPDHHDCSDSMCATGGAPLSGLTHHRRDGSLCRSTEATPCQSNSFCWEERKQRVQLNTCTTRPSPHAFSSPVFAGEVDSQQDVLLCVLPPAGVHHHHVPHAIWPRTLQPHCLNGGKANRRGVN